MPKSYICFSIYRTCFLISTVLLLINMTLFILKMYDNVSDDQSILPDNLPIIVLIIPGIILLMCSSICGISMYYSEPDHY